MRKQTLEGWTYQKAGVDIERVGASHRLIREIVKETEKKRGIGRVIRGAGHYAGLIEIGEGVILAIHTDGVGTKILIAQMMNRFDTVGIDCIAMNVNDLVCVGAKPLAFVDYIALKKVDQELVEELMKGLVKGAKEASISIVGGETAIMPDVIEGVGEKAFDLVGTALGFLKKNQIITGSNLKVGDILMGVESSGIHSNGLSLARKVLLQNHKLDDKLPELNDSLGEELLRPTRIYVKPLLELLKKGIHLSGLAHITGGAFSKLKRIGDPVHVGFTIDTIPRPPSIFELLQKEGNISRGEMYRTFNMGIGFCICACRENLDTITDTFEKHRMTIHNIGTVTSKMGVTVKGEQIA